MNYQIEKDIISKILGIEISEILDIQKLLGGSNFFQ